MNKVVIIYGLPCTGKSSICDALYDQSVQQIRTDWIWREIFPSPKYDANESHIVFSSTTARLINGLQSKQSLILIEGVFASIERLYDIERLSGVYDYELFAVLLFASLNCLHLRNEARNNPMYQLPKGKIELLNARFNSKEFCDVAINTEKSSKEKTSLLIKTLIKNGR